MCILTVNDLEVAQQVGATLSTSKLEKVHLRSKLISRSSLSTGGSCSELFLMRLTANSKKRNIRPGFEQVKVGNESYKKILRAAF